MLSTYCCGNSKVRKLDQPLLRCENVRACKRASKFRLDTGITNRSHTFDVSMNDSLFMQVGKSHKHLPTRQTTQARPVLKTTYLSCVDACQGLRELAKLLQDAA
jgi:hypothetical protein